MSQPDQTWTIGRLLTWTTQFLKQRHVESPRLDAELLLAEACGCRRIDLYTRFDEPAGEAVRERYRELVRQRYEGTPVAYLLGRREFYSLSFRVTPDVLIPRPETEFVVVALLDRAKQMSAVPEGSLRIADVGTGSGILAVCAAKSLPQSRVTALDISPAALAVAADNVRRHNVVDRIELIESDLLSVVPAERRFDLIVSNPPYVSTAEMETLAPDVRGHEPRVALEAGPTGTEVIDRLIPQAADRLRPGGWLIVEISPMLESAVLERLAADGRFDIGPVVKDLAGHARVVQAKRRD
jgi:release factor glutamine methyltransferase